MCVNYTPTRNQIWLREHYDVALPEAVSAVDEVFPGAWTPLLRRTPTGRFECVSARFGLIPPWSRDRTISRHTYNARSETVASKPSFRAAWQAGRVGLVPMDAFFEPNWAGGSAERWQIRAGNGQPFAVACLWESWHDPDSGECELSCTLLTVNADQHPLLSRFHRPDEEKRSIVALSAAAQQRWWQGSSEERQACLALPDAATLSAAPAPRAARRKDGNPLPPALSAPVQGSLF